MRHRTQRIIGLLFVSLMMADAATAEGRRGRMGRIDRAISWEQTAPAAPPEDAANTAATYQEGSGNAAGIVQTGSGNAAGIRQFGHDNTGAITQTGTGNTACLIQAGRNLNGAVTQAGDNQTSGLLQTRWGASEIPVEVCTTATTRAQVMAYAPDRPEHRVSPRGRGRHRR